MLRNHSSNTGRKLSDIADAIVQSHLLLVAPVQAGAVVDEHIRHVDVEVALPVGQIAEPALGLLRQAVDEDHPLPAGVGVQFQVCEPLAPSSYHGRPSVRAASSGIRSPLSKVSPMGE